MEQPNNDIRIDHDETNFDLLVCRRMECFFTPNVDRTPSVDGKVIFHGEYWQYMQSGDRLRGTSIAAPVHKDISELIGGTYAGVSGVDLLAALKDLFYQVNTSQTPPLDIPTDTGEAPNEVG